MEFHGLDVRTQFKRMRELAPEAYRAFLEFDQKAFKDGAMPAKTKELIALGIAVAVRCDDCIGFHVKAALRQGATREEIVETLGMAIYMGAGPSVMYATHALEAFSQFSKQDAAAPAAAT
jgi:AhpD family alkylhydroperoxidase